MHFQYPPAAETKLVRCTRGAILDVIVDLRPESPTFLRHTSVELTADNRRSFFVPARFAHGYQVLEDATEVAYLTGAYYAPEHEGGLPYDDPRLAIAWPLAASRHVGPRPPLGAARCSRIDDSRADGGGRAHGDRRVIMVDAALRAREASGRPIRMGMIGAGFMGRGVANQVVNHVTGMRLSAVYARRVDQGVEAYTYATPGCEPAVGAARRRRWIARSRPDGRWSPTIRSCCAVRLTSTR